jgi:hypothetical protein
MAANSWHSPTADNAIGYPRAGELQKRPVFTRNVTHLE